MNFDIEVEANAMWSQVLAMRWFVIAIFLVALPAGVAVAASQSVGTGGIHGVMGEIIFVSAGLVTLPFGYLIYRVITSLGPGRLTVEPSRLEFTFGNGRRVAWSLASLRTVLVHMVAGPWGEPLNFGSLTNLRETPVPFIQRGLLRRYAVSNAAADAIRAALRDDGWREKSSLTSGPTYRGILFTLTHP